MICSVCSADKPEGEFYARKESPTGYRRDCKRCVCLRIKGHREENPEVYRQRETIRHQSSKRRAWRKTPAAKDYRRAYNKRYFAEHGVEIRRRQGHQQLALYAAARRARLRANGVCVVTVRDLRRLVARWGGLCAYCRARPWEQMDHVLPVARGGRHSIGNLLPACAPCNLRKRARLLVAFLAEAG